MVDQKVSGVKPTVHYRQSAECEFTGRDVIAECDALEAVFIMATDGNKPRALALAALSVGLALTANGAVLGEAVGLMLRERLAVACAEELAERRIPYSFLADVVA